VTKAKQLPSGAWRVQVFNKGGNPRYISFTADTEDEATYLALEWKRGRERKAQVGLTVGEAIDQYIDLKDGVLSPTTIANYRGIRRNNLKNLMDIPVKKLTPFMVQQAINEEAKLISPRTHKRHTPKTIANVHGLLSASLRMVDPDFILRTTLPAKQKNIVELSPAKDVLDAVKGTNVELPVLLAVWLSLSMSEIRGIQVSAIRNGFLTIKESVVQVEGRAISKKATKAYERTRVHAIPPYIMGLIEQTKAWKAGKGYIELRSGKAVTNRFQRVIEKAGLPHMRFHDLRHLNASVMVALGVPDLYAMERGGWKTKSTLNRVYQHTLSAERQAVDKKIDQYFESLLI